MYLYYIYYVNEQCCIGQFAYTHIAGVCFVHNLLNTTILEAVTGGPVNPQNPFKFLIRTA